MSPYDPSRPALPPLDPEIDRAVREAVAQFNAGCFFECHDTLEEVWIETRGRSRLFLQGLIQVAAGFHHLGNGNRVGAGRQLHRGIQKLIGYPEGYAGIDLASLRRSAGRWLARIEAAPVPPPTIEDLPKIRLLGERSGG